MKYDCLSPLLTLIEYELVTHTVLLLCDYSEEETADEEEEVGEKQAIAARNPASGVLDFWSKLCSSEAFAAGQLPGRATQFADSSAATTLIDAIDGSTQEDIKRFGAQGYLPMKVR